MIVPNEQLEIENLFEYYKKVVPSPNRAAFDAQYKKIKDKEPNWTPMQIKAALRYAIEHKGLTATSLGIVPYVMEDCRNYYAWLRSVKMAVAKYNSNNLEHIVSRQHKEEEIFV